MGRDDARYQPFDESQHPWPWEQNVYAGQEYLFAAFAIELVIHEGELVAHTEPHS